MSEPIVDSIEKKRCKDCDWYYYNSIGFGEVVIERCDHSVCYADIYNPITGQTKRQHVNNRAFWEFNGTGNCIYFRPISEKQ